jgi:hypothetical protein
LREGKALGSERGKVLGCGLRFEQQRKAQPGLYSFVPNNIWKFDSYLALCLRYK